MTDIEKLAAIAQSPEAEALRAKIEALPAAVLMANTDVAYVGGAIARWQAQYPKPAEAEG